jgi:isoamylase
VKNFFTVTLLSAGMPMMLMGDEVRRPQGGNNNAYCQDNELSWFDWDLTEADQALLEFTRRMLRIRRGQPVLHRQKFFQGRLIQRGAIKDLTWLRTDGAEMGDEEWQTTFIRALGVRLAGDALNDYDERGEPHAGHTLLLLMNAHHEDIPFTLPGAAGEGGWDVLMDTSDQEVISGQKLLHPGDEYNVTGRSLALMAWQTGEEQG